MAAQKATEAWPGSGVRTTDGGRLAHALAFRRRGRGRGRGLGIRTTDDEDNLTKAEGVPLRLSPILGQTACPSTLNADLVSIPCRLSCKEAFCT